MDAHDMREMAAEWHDQRAINTPDAFEMEFHQVSAAAIRALPIDETTSFRVAELERQNRDLQAANNRLLVRARDAERERDEALSGERESDAEQFDAIRRDRARMRERAAAAHHFVDPSKEEAARKVRVAMRIEEESGAAPQTESHRRAAPAIAYGDPIRKVGGAHEVDGYLAGVITWEGVEHPVMAIPVARGFLLHIYAWAQLARRAFVR
jgi:hypothetical protein